MNIIELLFGKKQKVEKLSDYPMKSAKHFGKTFNEWRTMKGFSHEKGSVPEGDLYDYCSECGWPNKSEWQTEFSLSGTYLDNYQYSLWLKFIGVMDPDRKPEDSIKVAAYINNLKK